MKINIRNTIENVVLIALTIIAVKFVMITPLEKQLERQSQIIVQLAEQEKYSYRILNEFSEKLKAKDGTIVIDLKNMMDTGKAPEPVDPVEIKPKEGEEGFFKRIFKR